MLLQIGDGIRTALAGAIWFARAGRLGGGRRTPARRRRSPGELIRRPGAGRCRRARHIDGEKAGGHVRGPDRRPVPARPAHVGRDRAAWREGAARPVPDAGRRRARDGRPAGRALRRSTEARPAGRACRASAAAANTSSTSPDLDGLARVHHQHAIGHAGDDAEVVADQDHGGVRLARWIERSSVEDLRLHGDVQRRRRLVRDQQSGSLAIAMAITTRWRMPPDSSCGNRRASCAGCGRPTSVEQFDRPLAEAVGVHAASAAARTRRPASRRCTSGSARSSDPGTPWRPGPRDLPPFASAWPSAAPRRPAGPSR